MAYDKDGSGSHIDLGDVAGHVPEDAHETLRVLVRAAGNGALTLLECKDRSTGKTVIGVFAVDTEGGEISSLTPLARLFDESDDIEPVSEHIHAGQD